MCTDVQNSDSKHPGDLTVDGLFVIAAPNEERGTGDLMMMGAAGVMSPLDETMKRWRASGAYAPQHPRTYYHMPLRTTTTSPLATDHGLNGVHLIWHWVKAFWHVFRPAIAAVATLALVIWLAGLVR